MDIKKVFLISLVALAILVSVSAVSAGLFDGLMGEQQKDNVIEIEGITFNTTNATNFTKSKEYSSEGVGIYFSDNGKGKCSFKFFDFNKMSDEDLSKVNSWISTDKQSPSQTIGNKIIYTVSSNVGDNVGEVRYLSIVENLDLNKTVEITSPDINETVKMASTLELK